MSREQLVASAYSAELALNSLKARYGIISKGMAEETEKRLYTAREMLDRIDEIVDSGREEQLAQIKDTVDLVNMSRAGGNRELELPTTPIKIRVPSTIWSLIRGW
jgi:hypothetical protein